MAKRAAAVPSSPFTGFDRKAMQFWAPLAIWLHRNLGGAR